MVAGVVLKKENGPTPLRSTGQRVALVV